MDDVSDLAPMDHDSSQSQPSELNLLGFIITNIINLRYFHTIVKPREMVSLVRDSRNLWIPNSINVINKGGTRIGVIRSSVADVLAPLIDSSTISVGAIVPKPFGATTPSHHPVQIHIFGRLADSAYVHNALAVGGLSLISDTHPDFTLLGGGLPYHDFVISEVTNAEERKSNEDLRVDDIFAMVGKNNAGIVPLEPPKDIVLTELLAHQKEALGWLVDRENPHQLPPFWEEKDGGFCFLPTNFQTTDRPEPLRGGILADDMGLGKTLTMLSLIATNRPSFTSHGSKNPNSGKRSGESWKQRKIDEENDQVSGPRATLVVCPKSVLSSWVAQLGEHIKAGSLKFCSYYQAKIKDIEKLKKYDVVLTTYHTMAMEHGSGNSTLECIDWLRVVLDEAHVIENLASKKARAVLALKAERRWTVTVAPSPSRTLYSLISFLRFKPFTAKDTWRQLIRLPLRKSIENGNLRAQSLIGTITLRRMKDTCRDGQRLVALPPKVVETCFVELSAKERKCYDETERWSQSKIGSVIYGSTLRRNYNNVLYSILWLQQICNDVALCPFPPPPSNLEVVSKNPKLHWKFLSKIKNGFDYDCPICLSQPEKIVITQCAHIFCEDCILRVLKQRNPPCPICREPLSRRNLFFVPPTMVPNDDEDDLQKLDNSGRPLSSKVEALLKLLIASREANPSKKSVIFSHFREMLILLEEPLKAAGFRVLCFHGDMDIKQRTEVIQEFEKSDSGSPTILVAALLPRCAGINLTAASTVYLLDTWWDPVTEEQAIGKVHRLGQKEEVRVIRLIVRNSVEEKALEVQEQRKMLAGGALGRKNTKSQANMRLKDIRTLMGP
ncbi:putative DNA helicase chromatin remodeling SNF2 family [Dioscorea sansibarensis]